MRNSGGAASTCSATAQIATVRLSDLAGLAAKSGDWDFKFQAAKSRSNSGPWNFKVVPRLSGASGIWTLTK